MFALFFSHFTLLGRRDDEDDEIEEQLKVSENSWAAQQAKRQEKIRTASEVGTRILGNDLLVCCF